MRNAVGEPPDSLTATYRRWIATHVFGIVGGKMMRLAETDTLSTNDGFIRSTTGNLTS